MIETSGHQALQSAQEAISAGKFNEALALLRAAATAEPDNAETYYLAGECLAQLSDHKAALDAYRRAIKAGENWPAPFLGAARVLAKTGDAHASMQTLLHVLGFAPGHLDATRQLVGLLERLQPDNYLAALKPALQHCFTHPDVDPGPLSRLCAQQLYLGIADSVDTTAGPLPEAAMAAIAEDELWHGYLSRVINADPGIENLLVRLRRQICLDIDLDSETSGHPALFAALARQCFLNEYVFGITAEETTRLSELDAIIENAGESTGTVARAFAIRTMYRAPAADAGTQRLALDLCRDHAWLGELCRLAVFEPFEEAQIADQLPALFDVHHESSLAVQAQYEINPYPRWHAPPAPPQASLSQVLRQRFSMRPDKEPAKDGTRLLVAGCGTGFEPIDIARRDSSNEVTAIDLSRRSLAYASRQARSLGVSNIEFLQGDILDLHRTERQFDFIVCTGVLHHLADPQEGWAALCAKLASDGMMRISLYSMYARQALEKAREKIRELGLEGRPEDIREMRQTLLAEAGDRDFEALLQSADFYSMSGCRDLLFHVQEHQFVLPRIAELLDKLSLRFCGFDMPNPAVEAAFVREHPDPASLRDLDLWDRFERDNPQIFSEMYQFWCEPS